MRAGTLNPKQSADFIIKNANFIKINSFGIDNLSDKIIDHLKHGKLDITEPNHSDIHPSKEDSLCADWMFVIDALNFCFWSSEDELKWRVNGETGYNALVAAVKKAIEKGFDIKNPKYYSTITQEDLVSILLGDDNKTVVPLLKERLKILHEVGKILIEKYEGTFVNCILKANKSALNLVSIVVNDFPSFRDESTFMGKKVSFYKRAQILVADLWNTFKNEGLGEFHDIDELTMFADYRVPQVLLYFGVFEYAEELLLKLNNGMILAADSREEIEIRGCSIHAIELLKDSIRKKLEDANMSVRVPNAIELDYFLWCYRRNYAKELENYPFHKVLSTFY